MKKFFLASALLVTTMSAQAENPQFISSDGSTLSNLCVAAAQVPRNLLHTVKQYGYSKIEIDTIRCNGVPVKQFVNQFQAKPPLAVRVTDRVFNKRDSSPLTALCLAALASDETYQQLKQQHFASDSNLDAELKCNGMTLDSFIRRYRSNNSELSSASR